MLIVTIVSVVAALGFAWFAWRLRQEERRRSEARVAALSSAIDSLESVSYQPDAGPVAVKTLFAAERSDAAKGAPVIKLGVGVAMGLALLVAIAANNRGVTSTGEDVETSSRAGSTQAAPIELISMRHERTADTLKVSGLVRNPRRGGGTVAHVTAVVFAFNRAGAFVTSGRAALDFTTLEPGDESPFVVTIPGVSDVGRYRVSFRTEAGVVRHVDRRAEQMGTAARLE